MKAKINLFLVGAQKAGTTSLYEWLGQHPEANAPQDAKDYHFFTNEEIFRKGAQHLEELYGRDARPLIVHCAVNYLYFHEKAARRIYEYNPEARIIVCLREPVARAISAYKYCIKTLRESRSLSSALSAELAGELSTHSELADNTYIGHGRYAEQIRSFLDYFPMERVHILLFEDLINPARRERVMEGVLSFAGASFPFEFSYVHLNRSGMQRSNLINSVSRSPAVRGLGRLLLPRRLRKRVARSLSELNTSSKDIEIAVTSGDIVLLEEHLGAVRGELHRACGVDVTGSWRRYRFVAGRGSGGVSHE